MHNRKPCIVGNWKMVGSFDRIASLMQNLIRKISELPSAENLDIVLCPPFPYLQWVGGFLAQAMKQGNHSGENVKGHSASIGSASISLGAQNVYFETEGAFTGEVSVSMLKDLGCQYVILGHSERRQWLQESDALIARKFQAAYDAGLTPILCVGETEAQRKAGQTLAVVSQQVKAVLNLVPAKAFKTALLAYEPVWAIGTGQTASPAQAQEVHAYLRGLFKAAANAASNAEEDDSQALRILYGGSVKANNAKALFAEPDIDGALLGGASLNAEEFTTICRQAMER